MKKKSVSVLRNFMVFILLLYSAGIMSADSLSGDELKKDLVGKWERIEGDRWFDVISILNRGIFLVEDDKSIGVYEYKIEDGKFVWMDSDVSGDWVPFEIMSVGFDNADRFTFSVKVKFPWETEKEAQTVTYKLVKKIYYEN